MGRGYLVVEGHGEVLAAHNLIIRLWQDLGLPQLVWAEPIRGIALHKKEGIIRACGYIRSKPDADCLLILRDEEDECPKSVGPSVASWLRDERLPFPCAIVMFCREYETLFLPCLHLMAGKPLQGTHQRQRPGIQPGTSFSGDFESVRGVKEWLSARFPPGRAYKPTQDQLPLTRLIDFGVLRKSGLPCFGTLERAIRFLAGKGSGRGRVYPPPGKRPRSSHGASNQGKPCSASLRALPIPHAPLLPEILPILPLFSQASAPPDPITLKGGLSLGGHGPR
jgi:hypothetical protein